VGPQKKAIVGLLVFNPLWHDIHVPLHRLYTHLCAYFIESEIYIMHFTVDMLILFSILFYKSQMFCIRIRSKAIGKWRNLVLDERTRNTGEFRVPSRNI
jgi:hypothetical protein